jgi:ATP-binding cassette subfamily C protein CydC
MSTLRRLAHLASPARWRVAVAVLFGATTVVFGAGLMGTAGYLISRAAEQPPILSLTVAVVMVRFFGVSRPIARYLERLASHDLAFRVLGRLRVRIFERIEPLAPSQLEGFRRGDLLARMVGDVDALQDLYLRGLSPPIVAVVAGGFLVLVAAVFLPAAAVVMAGGLLVGGLAVPAVAGLLGRNAQRRTAGARAALTAELVDALLTAPDLAAYGRTDDALERVRDAEAELARLARRDAAVGGFADGLMVVVVGVTMTAVLATAVVAAAAGEIERVYVAMLILLCMATFEAVMALPAAAQRLAGVAAAGRRIFALADREPAVQDPAAPAASPGPHPTLVLEGVMLRYGPVPQALDGVPGPAASASAWRVQTGEPPTGADADADGAQDVLLGIDLRLEPGRRVALVGPSGAGKTSLAELLVRFRDPTAGHITLDGVDLRDLRQEDVRRTIGLAGQDAHIFNSSIRENVRLARPAASDEDIAEALRRARLWDWAASLPDGLDTLVGELGAALSGGQRQRLGIARVLLGGAPILVLDEPTAHLDGPTAEALVSDVLAEAGDRTVLLITHRREGLDLVDEVLTLRDGRLARGAPSA